MAKNPTVPNIELEEDGAAAFESRVAAEQAALEEELRQGKDLNQIDSKSVQDPRIPNKRGFINPIVFKKENTDMAFDALIRLNSKPVGELVEIKNGPLTLKACITPEGDITIIWSGAITLKD